GGPAGAGGRGAPGGGPGGGARGGPGGGGAGRGGRGGGPAEQPDQATQVARSNLQGLAKGKIAVMVAWGELDPPTIINFDQGLKDALCKTGRCPETLALKDHSHMSLVFSPNTADKSVTDPILKWMSGIK
ncbi:MAG TPA: hypothetical protein VFY29_15465, partial [Terriglobia bacterium]|nr:hypothetical protein [Terriglobia bacterium]